MTTSEPLPRFRLAGILLVLGLLIQSTTLIWSHPTAFLAFAFLGATLAGAGVLVYLYALAAAPRGKEKQPTA